MGLVTSNTDLKSLKFGKDRPGGGNSNQPYVVKDIPSKDSNPSPGGTTDFLLRGSLLLPSRILKDTSRLTQMFFDTRSPNGILFTAKQNLLSRTGVKTQGSGAILNEGAYTPLSSILQAAGNPIGLHLNKQGLDPTNNGGNGNSILGIFGVKDPLGLPHYNSIVNNNQPNNENRLIRLKEEKLIDPNTGGVVTYGLFNRIAKKGISVTTSDSNFISTNSKILFKYPGGPGSDLGIGSTIIRRYEDTSLYNTEQFKRSHHLLNYSQISQFSSSKDETRIQNFIETATSSSTNQYLTIGKKNLYSNTLDYTNQNLRIEGRVNLGDPGDRNKNVSNFTTGLGALDTLNAYPIYQSESTRTQTQEDPFNPVNDLVKFRIAIINNDKPNLKQFIHFRAFLDSFTDNYSSQWDELQYMGRGEKFYKYQGFDRKINMSWTVAAQSKEELIPMYHKLNYLASSLTPDYSSNGYMRGNLVSLTVGGYLYEQVGIITSLTYTIPEESPWEIGIDTEGGYDPSVKELPHIIKVTGFQFIPIHNFVPKIQKNEYGPSSGEMKTFGHEHYIALANGVHTDDEKNTNYKTKSQLLVKEENMPSTKDYNGDASRDFDGFVS
jgi:hypothetical protein